MSTMEKYKNDYIVFAEAGFIAINQADEDAAIKLFKAAEMLDPNNPLSRIGMGYLHLCKLELKQAVKIFEEILQDEPHNEMAKAFLGISLSLNPKEVDQGEKVLTQTAKEAHDPMVKDLAKNALDFVEKFVKKAAPPMQSHPKKSK